MVVLRLTYVFPGSVLSLANPFSLPTVRKSIAEVMANARSANITTSLDTGWDAQNRWIEDIGPGLPYTDLCS